MTRGNSTGIVLEVEPQIASLETLDYAAAEGLQYQEAKQQFNAESGHLDAHQLRAFVIDGIAQATELHGFEHRVKYSLDTTVADRLQDHEYPEFNSTYGSAIGQQLLAFAERQPDNHFLGAKAWRDGWVNLMTKNTIDVPVIKMMNGGLSAVFKKEIQQDQQLDGTSKNTSKAACARTRTAHLARSVIVMARHGVYAEVEDLELTIPWIQH